MAGGYQQKEKEKQVKWRFWKPEPRPEPQPDRSVLAFAYAWQRQLDVREAACQADRDQKLAEQGGEESEYTALRAGILTGYFHARFYKEHLLQDWGLWIAYGKYAAEQEKKQEK